MKHDMTSPHITPPQQIALAVALLVWLLIWVLAAGRNWPLRMVGSGLLATVLTAICISVRPEVMLYQPSQRMWLLIVQTFWLMSISTLFLGMVIFMVTTLLLPDPARSDEVVGSPSAPPSIEAPIGTAVRNSERYRAEIEALVRGAPSFNDSRSRLALPRSLPGDPLGDMAPPAGEAARQNTSTLMVFLTLTMPDEALAGWLEQTARAGGVAVIRGFHGDMLSVTLKRLTALQELAPAMKTRGGVSIDPTAFARFGVNIAPTVIISAAPLPPCATKGCAGDPAPAHDRIAGNVTLGHALRLLAADGDQATGVARHHLTRLDATDRVSGGGGP